MKDIQRILVICGITSNCDELVHSVATMAHGMNAELYALTVIYNPFGIMGLSFPRPSLSKDYQALIEKTRKDLQQVAWLEKQRGIVVHELISEGKPGDEIASVILEKNIDLLVVPAYTQTRLESLLTGQFNKTLLRKMPCSVMFLKSEPRAVPEEEEENAEEEAA